MPQVAVIVLAVLLIGVSWAALLWAQHARAKGLGVYEEDERLNREADARED